MPLPPAKIEDPATPTGDTAFPLSPSAVAEGVTFGGRWACGGGGGGLVDEEGSSRGTYNIDAKRPVLGSVVVSAGEEPGSEMRHLESKRNWQLIN